MKTNRFLIFVPVLLVTLLFVNSCKPKPFPNPGSDVTNPGLLQVVVRLESPTPPNQRAEFDITTLDVVRTDLDANSTLRLIATVGDPESGIKSIQIRSNLTWQCSLGSDSEIIGIVENAPIAFSSFTQPAQPITPFQINVEANPLVQAGCDISTPGKGPVNFRGFVRVIITNGNNMVDSSKTFIFDYKDVGSF